MQTQINNAFADLNAEILERQTTWAVEAYNRYREEKAAIYADRSLTSTERWEKLFSICGGKVWLYQFSGRSEAMVREFVKKNVAATIAKRDARIIKALEKKGVTEIPEFELIHSSDGYEGYFNVAGHTVSIISILAGGYNIQCLHVRTLIKVK